MQAVADTLEEDVALLGVTGVDDRLQVPFKTSKQDYTPNHHTVDHDYTLNPHELPLRLVVEVVLTL